jgi:hypothetical protein
MFRMYFVFSLIGLCSSIKPFDHKFTNVPPDFHQHLLSSTHFPGNSFLVIPLKSLYSRVVILDLSSPFYSLYAVVVIKFLFLDKNLLSKSLGTIVVWSTSLFNFFHCYKFIHLCSLYNGHCIAVTIHLVS